MLDLLADVDDFAEGELVAVVFDAHIAIDVFAEGARPAVIFVSCHLCAGLRDEERGEGEK